MQTTILEQLQSFYRRRIAIPVTSSDLVLDIGSGDKPHWRADVLLDQYVKETDGIQRSGSSSVVVSKPLIVAPIESMPFKDKIFDYVICSHILEHVMDPKKAIQEITRIGKAGYIEVPFEGAAKVIDVPSHLWYCRKIGKALVFTSKKSVAFDDVIDQLMSTHEMLYGFASLGQKYWDKFVIELHWEKTIQFKVIGKASKKLFHDAQKAEVIHNTANFHTRNILNTFAPIFFWNKNRQKKVQILDIMQCNVCKSDMKERKPGVICTRCKQKIQVLQA